MKTRTIAAVVLAAIVITPAFAQQSQNHYYGSFFVQNSDSERRVTVLCVRGGTCRFEMASMVVRRDIHQCTLITIEWDNIAPTAQGRRFHTSAQRQGTHATSTFSFVVRRGEVTSFREVYEIAEIAGRPASRQTFEYRPLSQRDGGAGFDVSGCEDLSLQ